MLIVCGDLARAIRQESNQSIVYWFGSNVATVSQWRGALHVPRHNPGTRELKRAWAPEMLEGVDYAAAARASHRSPRREWKLGTAVPRGQHPNHRVWTPEEVALLGTMSDAAVAKQIGCSTGTVGIYRRDRGIAAFDAKRWQQREKSLIAICPSKLVARRLALKLSQAAVAQRTGFSAYYKKLEVGNHLKVHPATAERLALALECAVTDII